jgi:hypothetical protein
MRRKAAVKVTRDELVDLLREAVNSLESEGMCDARELDHLFDVECTGEYLRASVFVFQSIAREANKRNVELTEAMDSVRQLENAREQAEQYREALLRLDVDVESAAYRIGIQSPNLPLVMFDGSKH